METEIKSEVSTESQKGVSIEPQKKPRKLRKPRKVTEVRAKQVPDNLPKQKVNRNLHEVIVDGKSRSMTKFSYDAIVKDPNKTVELPSGSRLVEPENKPCKDC